MLQTQIAATYNYTITVGAMMRRSIRRQLTQLDLTYTEEKTLLTSDFRLTGLSWEMYRSLVLWVSLLSAT